MKYLTCYIRSDIKIFNSTNKIFCLALLTIPRHATLLDLRTTKKGSFCFCRYRLLLRQGNNFYCETPKGVSFCLLMPVVSTNMFIQSYLLNYEAEHGTVEGSIIAGALKPPYIDRVPHFHL